MDNTKEYILVYITAPDEDSAKRIGRTLLEERLCACVNIVPRIKSMYWWQGKIEEDSEAVLIAKTRRDVFPALQSKVLEVHPYTCPCVIAIEIKDGYEDFLRWIDDSLAREGKG